MLPWEIMMINNLNIEVKKIIINSIGEGLDINELSDHFELLGNLLDSMSVTNLIIGIEENSGIYISDEELSEDIFYTVGSLISFIEGKLGST